MSTSGDPGATEWHEGNWGREPYTLPEPVREPMEDILAGRILSGFEDDENLRSIIDQVGAGSLMYASGYPHSDLEWGRVDAIKNNDSITQEERAALLGGNGSGSTSWICNLRTKMAS